MIVDDISSRSLEYVSLAERLVVARAGHLCEALNDYLTIFDNIDEHAVAVE